MRICVNLSSWPEAKVEALAPGAEGPAPGRAGGHLRDRPQPAARARGRGARHDPGAGPEGADRCGGLAAAGPGDRDDHRKHRVTTAPSSSAVSATLTTLLAPVHPTRASSSPATSKISDQQTRNDRLRGPPYRGFVPAEARCNQAASPRLAPIPVRTGKRLRERWSGISDQISPLLPGVPAATTKFPTDIAPACGDVERNTGLADVRIPVLTHVAADVGL